MNACPGDRNQVLLAHELVLHVLGHVLEAIDWAAQRRAHVAARKQLEVGAVKACLDGVAVPVVLVGDPPVGRDALHDVRDAAIQGPGGTGQLVGCTLFGGAVATDFSVE